MRIPIKQYNSHWKATVDAGSIYKIKQQKREERNAKLLLAVAIVIVIGLAVYGVVSLAKDIKKKPEVKPEMKADYQIASFKEPEAVEDKEILASWYDYDLESKDQKCRDESCYSKFNLTAASRDYPRGSRVEVCYQGKCIVVRINDFGPEEQTGRDIDLSSAAFKELADLKVGLLEVIIK